MKAPKPDSPVGRALAAALADGSATVGRPAVIAGPSTLAALPAGLTEKAFTALVIAEAHRCGWDAIHFRPLMDAAGRWQTAVEGDGEGWPDLILMRPPVLMAAELKVGRNRPTPAQLARLVCFRACGHPGVLWYPRHWPEIQSTLGRA